MYLCLHIASCITFPLGTTMLHQHLPSSTRHSHIAFCVSLPILRFPPGLSRLHQHPPGSCASRLAHRFLHIVSHQAPPGSSRLMHIARSTRPHHASPSSTRFLCIASCISLLALRFPTCFTKPQQAPPVRADHES